MLSQFERVQIKMIMKNEIIDLKITFVVHRIDFVLNRKRKRKRKRKRSRNRKRRNRK